MLLTILRVAYLLICVGAILAYIQTDDTGQTHTALPAIVERNKIVAFFGLLFLTQIATIVTRRCKA